VLLQMSRARADEEEYWHSSKFRAFTFDDEDDELSQVGAEPPPRPALWGRSPTLVCAQTVFFPQLKESKRAVNSLRDIVDDDDDDLEKVSWSGEPVGSKCGVLRAGPGAGQLASPITH